MEIVTTVTKTNIKALEMLNCAMADDEKRNWRKRIEYRRVATFVFLSWNCEKEWEGE